MDSRYQSGSTIDLLPVKCVWGSRESQKVCCSSNLLIDLSETPVIIDVCWTGFIVRGEDFDCLRVFINERFRSGTKKLMIKINIIDYLLLLT